MVNMMNGKENKVKANKLSWIKDQRTKIKRI